MKVYTNTTFKGHWPVGTAAVVVAESPEQAAELLAAKLRELHLPQDVAAEDMRLLRTNTWAVCVLNDGNY